MALTNYNHLLLWLFLFIYSIHLDAQIAINSTGSSPDCSVMLDIASSDKGMLVPRMTTGARMSIAGPTDGLLVYVTATSFVGDGAGLTNLKVPDYSSDISNLQGDVINSQDIVITLRSDLSTSQSEISELQNDLNDNQLLTEDNMEDIADLQVDIGNTSSIGGNQSHNNMPPFYTINFIIKAE